LRTSRARERLKTLEMSGILAPRLRAHAIPLV
jgi:hypothetical protein